MKVKVLRQFYDKENDLKLRAENEVFEVEDRRAKLLMSRGFVMKAPEEKKPETRTVTKKNEAAE